MRRVLLFLACFLLGVGLGWLAEPIMEEHSEVDALLDRVVGWNHMSVGRRYACPDNLIPGEPSECSIIIPREDDKYQDIINKVRARKLWECLDHDGCEFTFEEAI